MTTIIVEGSSYSDDDDEFNVYNVDDYYPFSFGFGEAVEKSKEFQSEVAGSLVQALRIGGRS